MNTGTDDCSPTATLTTMQGSLLWLAMNEGQATAVQALLDGAYDVNRRHTNLETPLHLAIRMGDVATAMKLLVAGATATVPGMWGCMLAPAPPCTRLQTHEIPITCEEGIYTYWCCLRVLDGQVLLSKPPVKVEGNLLLRDVTAHRSSRTCIPTHQFRRTVWVLCTALLRAL